VEAVQEKVIVEQEAERDKKATEDILRQIPAEFISRQAARDLRPSGEPEFETVPPDEESQRTAGQIKELVSEGNRALAGGDADRAEQFYLEAETIEKASPQVQQITKQYVPKSLGYVYLQKGEPQKAIEEFKKALERNPEDEEARKGLIYAKTLAEKQRR
jgi:tetratricopeptide (TPR) repeat protein